MKVEKIAIEKIVPYKKNVKRHSELQIQNIAKSIEEVGFIQPIVVDENMEVIIGHGRLEALKLLGRTEADCIVLKGLTEAKKKALRIKDNKLNESPFDISNLQQELQALYQEGVDLQDLGFSMYEIEQFGLELQTEAVDTAADFVDDETIIKDSETGGGKAFDFSNVQGNAEHLRIPLTFYLTAEDNEHYGKLFATERKREANVDLLKEIVDFYLQNKQ